MVHGDFLNWLRARQAPEGACEWVLSGKLDLTAAWASCDRADWMLWLAAQMVDRPTLVLAACSCARTALTYIPSYEKRPRAALETAERWARGKAQAAEVRKAAEAAATAWANCRDSAERFTELFGKRGVAASRAPVWLMRFLNRRAEKAVIATFAARAAARAAVAAADAAAIAIADSNDASAPAISAREAAELAASAAAAAADAAGICAKVASLNLSLRSQQTFEKTTRDDAQVTMCKIVRDMIPIEVIQRGSM